jgi:hypothetical protein
VLNTPAAVGIAPANPAASAVLGQPPAVQAAQKAPVPPKKKKSFFDKLKGIF